MRGMDPSKPLPPRSIFVQQANDGLRCAEWTPEGRPPADATLYTRDDVVKRFREESFKDGFKWGTSSDSEKAILRGALVRCLAAMEKSQDEGCTDRLDACDDGGAFWSEAKDQAKAALEMFPVTP